MNWQGAGKTIKKPFVSVIIPVFNDAHRLQTCLLALESQTYPQNDYEIIVVDNDSYESIEKNIGRFGHVSVFMEKRPGSYAARNRGIASAKGEVIAFTDSDCIPSPDWIEKGVENLHHHHPQCGLVAGMINLFFKNPQHLTPVELYESLMAFPQKTYIEKLHFGATANMFTLKSVFDEVGVFNDKLQSGGDREWGQRVFSLGYKQVYAKDTCIDHPARFSFRQLYQKLVRTNSQWETDFKKKGNQFTLETAECMVRFFVPPLKTVFIKAFFEPRLHSIKDKLKLAFVLLYRHYVICTYKINTSIHTSL